MDLISDPVMDWMAVCNYHLKLEHEAAFDLDLGLLALRSNTADIINLAHKAFCYYPLGEHQPSTKSETIIEVYCAGSEKTLSFREPDPTWRNLFSEIMTNANSTEIPKEGFAYIHHKDVECFWKPNDLLISFSYHANRPIRILVFPHCKTDVSPHVKGRYRVKGTPPVPENAHEIIDLIKLLYIKHQNLFCIHAASVAIGNNGIIFTGPSGAGKSTTALSLIRDGAILLSDELTLVEKRSGEPLQIRGLLIPPSIVGKKPVKLDRLETTLNSKLTLSKCSVPLPPSFVKSSKNCSPRPVAIFFIEKAEHSCTSHKIIPMSVQEAFVELVAQVLDMSNTFQRDSRSDAIITLAETCRAYRLFLGRDLQALPKLIKSFVKQTDV